MIRNGGSFDVLAKNVLDVDSWGRPDLLYYRDGISIARAQEIAEAAMHRYREKPE